jgi:hypothetical protein
MVEGERRRMRVILFFKPYEQHTVFHIPMGRRVVRYSQSPVDHGGGDVSGMTSGWLSVCLFGLGWRCFARAALSG